ncbi:unnamed protein product [Enterobius vermicularis]|uniref:SERPIN domain-containing protein n=1 Tax=Enterobius vermicularis TaxID=51028 RepID=A0A0N4V2B4_ENTVE|nr:unnamed protein product [Enterobius vermicularis]
MTTDIQIAQADYTLGLLREAAVPNVTMVLSAFSITSALAVVYLGAGGNTKEEIRKVLAKGDFFCLGSSDDDFHRYVSQNIKGIAKGSDEYTLTTANRLFYNQNLKLREDYVNAVQTMYSGQLESIDFSESTRATAKINNWVEKQTKSKIKNLVKPGIINSALRLMVINAVYFKGDWASKFQKALTVKKPFYNAEQQKQEVDMMQKLDHFDYYEDSDVQVLGIPYKGNEVTMFILLPVEKFGLAKLFEKINGKMLMDYTMEAVETKVQVQIPKFRIEKEYELNQVLSKMGMPEAFSSNANFSKMSSEPLFISYVIHKAFIEVNEEGTEAAAATAIGMTRSSFIRPVQSPPKFIADHPFAFIIAKNGNILFAGKYHWKMAAGMAVDQMDYTLGLLRDAAAPNVSMILSSFSITTALALVYLGADGNTKIEMHDLLAKSSSDDEFHNYISQNVEEIGKESDRYTLTIANRLFYKKEFTMKEDYVNAVQTKYFGQLESFDSSQPTATAARINSWVEKETNSKIKNIAQPDIIGPDSRLLVLNAVYFKANWESPFQKESTEKKPFYVAEGEHREVDMMQAVSDFYYYKDEDVQVLGIPYVGGKIKMLILLPAEKFGLHKLLTNTDGKKLFKYVNEVSWTRVQVEIPKFRLEKEYELNNVLTKMGMVEAFSSNANFSKMTTEGIFISKMIHKTFIQVDEEGTEAAAATINVVAGSAPIRTEPPKFIADHPFAFFIAKNSTILFAGKHY